MEGKRECRGGDALGNREIALAVSEPLAIERLQVDGREVDPRRNVAAIELGNDTIAVDVLCQTWSEPHAGR